MTYILISLKSISKENINVFKSIWNKFYIFLNKKLASNRILFWEWPYWRRDTTRWIGWCITWKTLLKNWVWIIFDIKIYGSCTFLFSLFLFFFIIFILTIRIWNFQLMKSLCLFIDLNISKWKISLQLLNIRLLW